METTISHAIPYAKRWAALAVICTAQFMVIMDTSIIGVALPAIQKDLGYSSSGLQWIFNAYVILLGGLLLLGGKLSDMFGPRKIFMWGFGILVASSLLAGFAWSETSMNIGRALQGAGSALIAPSALTLLMTTFADQKELGKAFGFWGASAAAGGSAGVFLGGLLTEWLSWNWVFFINIPLGLIVLLLSKPYLPEGMKQKSKLDLPGALIATLSLVILVYAIVSPEQTVISKTVSIVVSIVLLIIFILRQKKSRNPLLPLSIFKAPNLAAGNLVMMLMAASWIPLWFYLNLYLQQVLQLSAFNSGLALLPMTIVIMILMVGFTGKIVAKFGFKGTLVAGLIALTGSLVAFTQVDAGGSYLTDVLPASILGAVGMSLAYIPGTIASMSGAKPEETGLASGIANTSYQVGSAIGLAIIVAIATSFLGLGSSLEEITGSIKVAFGSAAMIAAVSTVLAIIYVKQPK
ncbi:MAG: transporter [Bacteroidetes bacterium]|jgi:EmrB/QacA subfamily drug resistance transporter|nr:transporter [Bacteroidota bacterium]